GETGLTVPPQDADALASAIKLLLDKDDLRAQYGKAARQRVEQEFSLDCMVSRTLQLYEKVMSASHESHTTVAATSTNA
ncbi:MAG TPA: glycosyltransferase, partial [Blastocatellia bacterium]|nr:glycosyltransferase [Blastocatellia bacterium]